MKIDMKVCIKCLTEKSLSEFSRRKDSKDGFNNKCKKCKYEYTKKRLESNPNYLEKRLKSDRRYREKNKEIIIERNKYYYHKNKERILRKNSEYQKRYLSIKDNRYKRNKKINNRFKDRSDSDFLFVLTRKIKSSIKWAFKSQNYLKRNKTEKILGCSFVEFKIYLESKFETWMTWENRGLYNGELNYGWDIDHITPLSSASSEDELIKLNHFENLQPLCSKINRDIKKDNLLLLF